MLPEAYNASEANLVACIGGKGETKMYLLGADTLIGGNEHVQT
jgi:hypothetical protein